MTKKERSKKKQCRLTPNDWVALLTIRLITMAWKVVNVMVQPWMYLLTEVHSPHFHSRNQTTTELLLLIMWKESFFKGNQICNYWPKPQCGNLNKARWGIATNWEASHNLGFSSSWEVGTYSILQQSFYQQFSLTCSIFTPSICKWDVCVCLWVLVCVCVFLHCTLQKSSFY